MNRNRTDITKVSDYRKENSHRIYLKKRGVCGCRIVKRKEFFKENISRYENFVCDKIKKLVGFLCMPGGYPRKIQG